MHNLLGADSSCSLLLRCCCDAADSIVLRKTKVSEPVHVHNFLHTARKLETQAPLLFGAANVSVLQTAPKPSFNMSWRT